MAKVFNGKDTRFSSTYQPTNRRGRGKSTLGIIKDTEGITRAQYNDTLARIPNLTTEQAQEILADPTTPLWVISRVRALWKDIDKGKTDTLREIEERLFGKPTQGIDITSAGGKVTTEPLTVEIIDSRDKVIEQAEV